MSALLRALSGDPRHGEPFGSLAGMIIATTLIVAATLRLGW